MLLSCATVHVDISGIFFLFYNLVKKTNRFNIKSDNDLKVYKNQFQDTPTGCDDDTRL